MPHSTIDDNIKVPLYETLGKIAALWVIASFGYYLLLPMLGYDANYDSQPIIIAVYFLLWAIVSV